MTPFYKTLLPSAENPQPGFQMVQRLFEIPPEHFQAREQTACNEGQIQGLLRGRKSLRQVLDGLVILLQDKMLVPNLFH